MSVRGWGGVMQALLTQLESAGAAGAAGLPVSRITAALMLLSAMRWGMRQNPPRDRFVCGCTVAFVLVVLSLY